MKKNKDYSNDNNKDKDKNNSFLKKKRKEKYCIEKIIYLYCIQNNIKENEIKTKIRNFNYEDPDTGEIIVYDNNINDKLPLSQKKLHNYFIKGNKNENKSPKKNIIKKCNFCNLVFHNISEEEKIKHLNLCFNKL